MPVLKKDAGIIDTTKVRNHNLVRRLSNHDIVNSPLRKHEINTRWTGYNLSGFESGKSSFPGVSGIHYPDEHDRVYFEWCKANNVKTIRLCILLERLLTFPVPVGGTWEQNVEPNFFTAVKKSLDLATEFGIEVFLDLHNYGSYFYYPAGGFKSKLNGVSSRPENTKENGNVEDERYTNTKFTDPKWFFNIFDPRYLIKTPIGDPGNIQIPAGYDTNVSINSYSASLGLKFDTIVEIVNRLTPEQPWYNLFVVAGYIDESNFYFVDLNITNDKVNLYSRVAGVNTLLGSVTYQIKLKKNIRVAIDINKSEAGKVYLYIEDEAPLIVNHNSVLTNGKVGFKNEGVKANIIDYKLSIGPDYSYIDNVFPAKFTDETRIEIRNPIALYYPGCYENLPGGCPANPLATDGYRFNTRVSISTREESPNQPNSEAEVLLLTAMYENTNNNYTLAISPVGDTIILFAKLNGVETKLGTFPTPIDFYKKMDFSIDVNQEIPGKILVYYNGVKIFDFPHNSALRRGKVGYYTQGVNAEVYNYELLVGTDNVKGFQGVGEVFWGFDNEVKDPINNSVLFPKTFAYSVDFHSFVYELLFNKFDSYNCIIGYMYNEPHDLKIPTTPQNYNLATGDSLLSTATLMQRTALSTLRTLGSKKWFGWTTDNWGGMQNLEAGVEIVNGVNQGGSNDKRWGPGFNIPWVDPIDKTFLDLHFYPDNYLSSIYLNSGTFGSLDGAQPIPFTKKRIERQTRPALDRLRVINTARIAQNKLPIPFCLSETGVPNDYIFNPYNTNDKFEPQNGDWTSVTDYKLWSEVLDYIFKICVSYNGGFMYFSVGKYIGNQDRDIHADITTPKAIKTPTSKFDVDTLGELIDINNPSLGRKPPKVNQTRHKVVARYLNKNRLP
jgi:hypothetical protein